MEKLHTDKINLYHKTINFNLHRYFFEAFRYNWNKERPSSEQLKMNHRDYFYDLLRIARAEIIKKQKRYDYNPDGGHLVKITTNNVKLAKKRSSSPRTIINYNQRLLKAGVIKKVFHGTNRDYDIILNEYLVFYTYLEDRNYIPPMYENSKVLAASREFSKRKNLRQLTECFKLKHNKQLIDKEYQNQKLADNLKIESNSSNETKFNGIFSFDDFDTMMLQFYRIDAFECDTHTADGQVKPPPIPPAPPEDVAADNSKNEDRTNVDIEGPGRKTLRKISKMTPMQRLRKTDLNELRIVYAQILYHFALTKIPGWKDSVYEGTAGEVILYIAENYFAKAQNKTELSKQLHFYQLAIERAGRWIRKRILSERWERFWTFPSTWFDVKYTKGFRKAIKYQENRKKLEQKALTNAKRMDVNQKLNEILLEYFTTNEDNYAQLLAKVRNTIPSRESQFKFCVKNGVKEVAPYWNVTEDREIVTQKTA